MNTNNIIKISLDEAMNEYINSNTISQANTIKKANRLINNIYDEMVDDVAMFYLTNELMFTITYDIYLKILYNKIKNHVYIINNLDEINNEYELNKTYKEFVDIE